jgi:hypothetical protein
MKRQNNVDEAVEAMVSDMNEEFGTLEGWLIDFAECIDENIEERKEFADKYGLTLEDLDKVYAMAVIKFGVDLYDYLKGQYRKGRINEAEFKKGVSCILEGTQGNGSNGSNGSISWDVLKGQISPTQKEKSLAEKYDREIEGCRDEQSKQSKCEGDMSGVQSWSAEISLLEDDKWRELAGVGLGD